MIEGNVLFQMLMPLNFGLFAAMFFGIYFYEKRLVFTGWVGMGFLCGMLASLIDILQHRIDWSPFFFDDFANPLYWSIGTCFLFAMTIRYRQPFPIRVVVMLYAIGIIAQIYLRHLTTQPVILESITNIVAGLILGLAALAVRRNAHSLIDKIVWMLMAGACISNVLRIILVFSVLDNDFNYAIYSQSLHASAQLFSGAVWAALGALSLMVLCALDLVNIYRSESTTDALTGLGNRRGLDNHIDEINETGGLNGYSLIICDLDNFKLINDKHGHHTGDMVLRRVAKTIDVLVKSFGYAARVGGEEFAILIRPVESEATRFVADQLCQSLRQLNHPEVSGSLNTTASFGIGRIEQGEPYGDAYKRVDRALYTAKREGRDRVVEAETFIQNTVSLRQVV